MKILNKNIKLFYTISFLNACIFTTSIWSFFFTKYLTFSFKTAMFIVVFSWIVSAIFEIPSWAWADRLWRKKMYFYGVFLIILSYSFWLFADTLYLFLISSLLCWIWFAITSWNIEALIHDSLEWKWVEARFKDIQANAHIFNFSWRFFSSVFAGYLFIMNPKLPIFVTILAYSIVFIILFFLKESSQELSHSKNTRTHIKEWLDFILKNDYIFYFISIVCCITSIWNVYWFTYQLYFEQIGFSIENIWIVFAVIWLFSAVWAYIIKRLQNILSEKQIVLLMLLLLFVSEIFLQFFNAYLAILWAILIAIMHWFIKSFWNNVLIKRSPKTHKSTILSVFSLWITAWYWIFSIVSWFIVDCFWLKELYLLNILLTIAVIMFSLIRLRKKKTHKKDTSTPFLGKL